MFDVSKYEFDRDPFEISKMFYHSKGAAKAAPIVVQLFLLMFYFWVREGILDFQFTAGNSPFETMKMFFRMDGWDSIGCFLLKGIKN